MPRLAQKGHYSSRTCRGTTAVHPEVTCVCHAPCGRFLMLSQHCAESTDTCFIAVIMQHWEGQQCDASRLPTWTPRMAKIKKKSSTTILTLPMAAKLRVRLLKMSCMPAERVRARNGLIALSTRRPCDNKRHNHRSDGAARDLPFQLPFQTGPPVHPIPTHARKQ